MSKITPLPSVYFPEFIAANQSARADNVITGSKQQQLDHVRSDIQQFKKAHGLDKVIVLWTANTERFAAVEEGVNDTSEALLAAIARGEDEISPSTLFAVACILDILYPPGTQAAAQLAAMEDSDSDRTEDEAACGSGGRGAGWWAR